MQLEAMQWAVLAAMPGLPIQIVAAFLQSTNKEIARRWEWIKLEDDFLLNTSIATFSTTNDTYITTTKASADAYISDDSELDDTTAVDSLTTLYHIRINGEPNLYEVAGVTNGEGGYAGTDNKVTLSPVYGGETLEAADEAPWSFFKYIYELNASCRELLSISYEDKLTKISTANLQRKDPERTQTGTPIHYCLRGKNVSGQQLVELWPRPIISVPISYRARIDVPVLDNTDESVLDENLIIMTTLFNLVPTYIRMFPDAAQATTLSAKLWKGQADQMYSDLVMEDMRLHTPTTRTRDTMFRHSGDTAYDGGDISAASMTAWYDNS